MMVIQAKQLYWCSFWLIIFATVSVSGLAFYFAYASLDDAWLLVFLPFVFPEIIYIFACIGAETVVRYAGLSQENIEVEALQAVAGLDHKSLPQIEVHAARRSSIIVLCLLAIASLFLLTMPWHTAIPDGTQLYAYLAGGFLLSLCCWGAWEISRGGVLVSSISAQGIYASAQGTCVPWSEIAFCEITKNRDVKGNDCEPIYSLKGPQSFTLASFVLNNKQEQEHFEAVLRAHFTLKTED